MQIAVDVRHLTRLCQYDYLGLGARDGRREPGGNNQIGKNLRVICVSLSRF